MYILDISKMKQGDIILTTQSALQSKVIRKISDSDCSHAMLYLSRGSYIHADRKGVHSGNTQRVIFEDIDHAKVLRVKNCSPDIIEKICDHARTKVGTQYSVSQAIKSAIYRSTMNAGDFNRQFCSRLVAQSYDFGGVALTKNPDYCYPEDLARSPRVHEVPNCVRPASPQELEYAASDNPLEMQAEITNFILAEARSVFGKDVQTLEQITAELLRNPDKDQLICEIYNSSGYLDIWRVDITKNGWRYDEARFLRLPISAPKLKQLAADELASAKSQGERFSRMLGFYQAILREHDLSYIRLNESLYTQLLLLAQKRIQVAGKVCACA